MDMAKGGTMHRLFPRWFKPIDVETAHAAIDASITANRDALTTAEGAAESLKANKVAIEDVFDDTKNRIQDQRNRKARRLRASRRMLDAQAALNLLRPSK